MLLSPQKQQFVDGYLLHGDAIKAAVDAGYPADTAQVAADHLLADWQVVAAISGQHYAHTVVSGYCESWLREQLLTIYHRCMQPRPVPGQSVAGEGVWAFDSQGAVAALELLGKHIGFFGRHNQQQYPSEYNPNDPPELPRPTTPASNDPKQEA